ncbi:MAG: DNA adenine methylase [Planctomycetia bacterium]|nr:DNA adenine methylase [Planctomycetia bacterium]
MNETVKDYRRLNVPHPLPYQGSKRNLAPLILSYFPPHSTRLVEPFAGSAAISLAVAHRGLADRFLINDAHTPVIDLWRDIIEKPEGLATKYRTLWQAQLGREREYYDSVRRKFNETHKPEYFLYLLARCVKAAIRYNGGGEFNNSPDNRRKGAHPDTMRERIVGASALLQGRTEISACDYREVLANCNSADLVYMDPPYQGVCRNRDNRYCPKIDHREFCDSLAALNDKGCMYVVSYDGRTGEKTYGELLPTYLNLVHIEVHAGRSTQATLLGRDHDTYESLYLSSALAKAISSKKNKKPQMEFAW